MPFEKNKLPGTKEEFMRWLEERIIRGKLAVGEKLPTERTFEQQTGIGKSAIHGALIELEHKGFIKILPRKGAYVANYVREGTADTLNEILRCNGGRLSIKMSIEIVELRNAIEGGALIRLAKQHTDEDLAKLNAVLDELRAVDVGTAEIEEIAEIESRFHLLICELSGNDMFSLVMNSFSPISAVLWQRCALFWGVGGFIRHDEVLLDMISRGEGHEAQIYIENIFSQFLEAFYQNEA
ncbi:MAG: FCD domain-containing protein [Bacillota bacterium]